VSGGPAGGGPRSGVELLHLRLRRPEDVTRARQRTVLAARLLDVDAQEATRLGTVVSEVCRAGVDSGAATVSLRADASAGALLLRLELVRDASGRPPAGADRAVLRVVDQLMDEVGADPAGLVASKRLAPWSGSAARLEDVRTALLLEGPGDQLADVREHNDALTAALLAVRDREADLRRLNEELEQTNRGVVALYAELEQRAEQVRRAQRTVFEELEGALRPRPPVLPDVELDVRYLPAEAGSPTGGDLYDWLVLRDGRLHVTVVDVLGHGVTSTRDALLVTHAVRTLVLEGHDLGEVLARVDALLLGSHDVVATVLLAQLDARSGRLRLAGGGHPPALLVPTRGDAAYLEAEGRPIGYPLAGSDEVREHDLDPGDLVLLYTDGLIEVRKDVVEGLDTLLRAATAWAGSPTGQLLDGLLLDAAQGAAFNDDTLLLSLSWRPRDGGGPTAGRGTRRSSAPDAPGQRSLDLVLPAGAPAAAHARAEVRRVCEAGVPQSVRDDVLLVASELVGNAVRHGGPGPLRLLVDVRPGSVRVGVGDGAPGSPLVREAGHLDRGGRGMLLVERLASAWGVIEELPGKQVWARLDW